MECRDGPMDSTCSPRDAPTHRQAGHRRRPPRRPLRRPARSRKGRCGGRRLSNRIARPVFWHRLWAAFRQGD